MVFYAAALGAVVWMGVKPLIGQINANAKAIQKKVADQENSKQRLSELPALQKQFEKILAEEEKLQPLLRKEQAVELIEKIEKIAGMTNSQVAIEIGDGQSAKQTQPDSSGAEKETVKKTLKDNLPAKNYLEMKIKLTGFYPDIADFLGKIENIEYYSDITAISFSVLEDEKSQFGSNVPFEFAVKKDAEKNETEKNNQAEPGRIAVKAVLNAVFYLKDEK